MTKEIDYMLEEWKFSRQNTVELINALGDNGLKMDLPRPILNTFCKHFQEMISIQKSYSNAIKNGVMCFEEEEFDGKSSCAELIATMNEIDKEMQENLRETAFWCEIDWGEGEKKTVSSHLCALATHEIFHIGQLVAFCYVKNIKLPDFLLDNWALPQSR